MRARVDPKSRLVAGDRVWLLRGRLVWVGEVTAVRVLLEGDPLEFAMYEVRTLSMAHEHVHRSEVFAAPAEREAFLAELEETADRFGDYARELESQDEGRVPEVGDDI